MWVGAEKPEEDESPEDLPRARKTSRRRQRRVAQLGPEAGHPVRDLAQKGPDPAGGEVCPSPVRVPWRAPRVHPHAALPASPCQRVVAGWGGGRARSPLPGLPPPRRGPAARWVSALLPCA